jgi:hypothetical protein
MSGSVGKLSSAQFAQSPGYASLFLPPARGRHSQLASRPPIHVACKLAARVQLKRLLEDPNSSQAGSFFAQVRPTASAGHSVDCEVVQGKM